MIIYAKGMVMIMKRNSIPAVLSALLLASMVGCAQPATKDTTKPVDTKNITTLKTPTDKTTTMTTTTSTVASTSKADTRTISDIKKENGIKNNDPVVFIDKVSNMQYFPLITETPGTPMEDIKYVKISPDAPVQDKLTAIADGLSKNIFQNNPIKVVSITDTNGKKLATINLTGENWNNFLQGSTGATQTAKALIESTLQRSYDKEWIDSVKFTLNGKAINSEHAEILNKIISR